MDRHGSDATTPVALALAWVASSWACAGPAPMEPPPSNVAPEVSAPVAAPDEVAPGEPASDPERSEEAEAASGDALLVVTSVRCKWASVWRAPRECSLGFTGLVRPSGQDAWERCDVIETTDEVALSHRLLVRGAIRRSERSGSQRCTIESVSSATRGSEHGLHPLDGMHLGPLVLEVTREQASAHLGLDGYPGGYLVRERGSGGLALAAAWLTELPSELVIAGERTMTAADVRERFERALAESAPSDQLGLASAFAPTIADPETRAALARTPVTFLDGPRVHAIPLCRSGGPDFLVVIVSRRIPGSIERAWLRSVAIDAVVGGARPYTAGCTDEGAEHDGDREGRASRR